ncbi:hypothetical protein CAEBREN_09795 [Caenorhabditis brenneri]|uniref:Uncharacterized protein n=1 Tax=Caenorhabditis brenneri TaxID=135651 RepID=G0NBJ8_CAEBE|nr:hypothetical protein CAEBREN_09795 [Caenorhabditis brenneri]
MSMFNYLNFNNGDLFPKMRSTYPSFRKRRNISPTPTLDKSFDVASFIHSSLFRANRFYCEERKGFFSSLLIVNAAESAPWMSGVAE